MDNLDFILNALRNVKADANINAQHLGRSAKGVSGEGELNLSIPVGSGELGAMVSGSGAYGKAGNTPIRDFNVGRAGINYTQGNNRFSIDADPNDMRHNFMLRYGRSF